MDDKLPLTPEARLYWFQNTEPRLYAKNIANTRHPRFFGLLWALGSQLVPEVPVTSTLIRDIGVQVVAGTGCLPESPLDHELTHAARGFSALYNPELLRLLIAKNHPKVRRARQDALAELHRFLRAHPIQDAQEELKQEPPHCLLSIDGYQPETPGGVKRPDYTGHRFLKAFPSLLPTQDLPLLTLVIQHYVIPYNNYVATRTRKAKWQD